MFELADYIAFAAALLAGVKIGRRSRPKPPEPIKPQCSCEHGLGFHSDGLRCNAIDYPYEGNGRYGKRPCTCQRYDGPDPAIFGLNAR